MSTLRQLVSSTRSRNKLLSHDNHITDRAIASEIRLTAILLAKRETNLRRLWSTDSLFTTLPCIPMQEVPLAECGLYHSPKSISRSISRLPKIAEGNYQYIINAVTDIESSRVLKYMPVQRYINSLKLNEVTPDIYYWIQDRYLYCSSQEIKFLKMGAMFEDDIPYDILYPDTCDCKDAPSCLNPLDMDFNLPGYLEKNVLDMVSDILMKTYERVKEDVTSDDLEND